MENISGAIYINLDRREDRRAEFEDECKRIGITVERFSAIEQNPGFIGCTLSHIAVLKEARARGLKNVLIFEDDFTFLVDKETFNSNLQSFFDLNIDYDVLMLGYKLNQSEPFNDLIGRVKMAETTSCYLVHNRFYDRLIDVLESDVKKLISTHKHWLYIVDQSWKKLQPEAQWFYFTTRIGKQRAGFSDLKGAVVDYSF